jgi:hypothetical protein
MPVKIARSAPRPSFGQPELLVAIHASRQSYSKAGKARVFVLVWEFRRIPVHWAKGQTEFLNRQGKRFEEASRFGRRHLCAAPGQVGIGPIERIVSGFMAAL